MQKIAIMHSGDFTNPDIAAAMEIFTATLRQEGFVNNAGGFSILRCPGLDNPQILTNCANNFAALNPPPDVLVAAGGTRSAQIASAATATIPIVFTSVAFPQRLAANTTGICAQTAELDRKRLELLMELMNLKRGDTVGVLFNSDRFPGGAPPTQLTDITNAATALGLMTNTRDVGTGTGGDVTEIDKAFATWATAASPITAAIVAADPFFNNHRSRVIGEAALNGVATVYQWREFVDANGLISLGTRLFEAYRQAAIYTARILKGELPQNLPIVQLNSFELAVNLTTANDLGIKIPRSILARADHIVP
jgi:putative tryptophan/tyrosine transport system substrate-binding protein